MEKKLKTASNICQLFAYLSLIGVAMLWFKLSIYVGLAFMTSTVFAILLVRYAMLMDDESRDEIKTNANEQGS